MDRRILTVALGVAFIAPVAPACPIPLEPTRTSFTTTVHVGSKGPFRFLVDTGATMTVIDRAVAERIGIQPVRAIEAISTNGAVQVQESVVDELRVANESRQNVAVLVTDLPRFTSHGRVDGILGMNFFEGRSVRFDIRDRCLQIGVEAPAGNELVAHEVAGRVAIEAEGLNFVLDSGASFPVLTSPRARALAVEDGDVDLESVAGRRRTATATLPQLRLGRIVLRDVAVALATGRDARVDGLLPITPFASVYISADRKRVVLR